ncbi:predicted protein [Histoplasma mississippiense (nom. inval.)]|uniref:predicted protein n=1 Tax=Ajellomyces capsulatus (strain NAm1 / WU24) TaxID=2059318 RepID=UPI000157C495|nr:predicted protein [Histoplasma mississippiense (nom. inval.)]EDN08926.1 predicted protein [Histoplasma mississippiense (nom. inval.)]
MPANEHAVASSASSKPPSPDRNVKSVVLGNIRFKTWFHSLYPEELVGKDTDRVPHPAFASTGPALLAQSL